MGFYPPEAIVGDARRHGVDLLPPDIHRSGWQYTLERTGRGRPALRMGLSTVEGLGQNAWTRIERARAEAPFAGLEDVARRALLPRSTVENLIRAGALDSFGARRSLLWQVGQLHLADDDLGLEIPFVDVVLPPLDALEESAWEYELLGLSPAGQVMHHYRDALRRAGVLSTGQVKEERAGKQVWVGGMVVVRQRPPTAGGVAFLSLEDERDLLDVVLKPPVYERYKALLRGQSLLLIGGVVQRQGRAVSLLASALHGL